MSDKEKILVIKLGALGDFIQALGPMASIRNHHPDAHITLLTTKPFEKLAQDCGYFDAVWLDERPKLYQIKTLVGFRKKLNSEKFSRVYDLQNNDRTGFYFKLLKPKPEWVGIARGASHRNKSKERTKGQAFDGHVMTLGLAGINNIKIDPLLWMKANTAELGLKDKYALLIPGSAPQHPYKRWPADKYAQIAQRLANTNIQPVLIGTEAESDITEEIHKQCPEALNLTGKTSLNHIAAIARSAVCALGNDTGPMHIIAPTGCASVILFSKHSNTVRHAPKGNRVKTLQVDDLSEMSVEMVDMAIAEYI
ncbi:MAG: glycosyltransferase family 9 protein [Alphaproteobacteria bacterium]|nr:glycosyltransferase family 9 protein [Alphaproteobacteria bacterium]